MRTLAKADLAVCGKIPPSQFLPKVQNVGGGTQRKNGWSEGNGMHATQIYCLLTVAKDVVRFITARP